MEAIQEANGIDDVNFIHEGISISSLPSLSLSTFQSLCLGGQMVFCQVSTTWQKIIWGI